MLAQKLRQNIEFIPDGPKLLELVKSNIRILFTVLRRWEIPKKAIKAALLVIKKSLVMSLGKININSIITKTKPIYWETD